MKHKNLFTVLVLIAALSVSISTMTRNNSRIVFYQDTIDMVFDTNFSLFCNGLNDHSLCQDKIGAEIKYIYLCSSIFNLTSYSENQDLNKIVRKLCNMSEQGILFETIDLQLVENLNRLSSNLDDTDAIRKICDSF